MNGMPANVHLLEVPEFDLIIFGGRVIDPANGIDSTELDVGVSGGVIVAVRYYSPHGHFLLTFVSLSS